MQQIDVNLNAVKTGVTPMAKLLRERGAKTQQEMEAKQSIARNVSQKLLLV